jgi:DNA-binding LacI/PurR family transcriptional regulator
MPNALARAMITKKTENLAFIIHEEQFPVITNPFYGQILESVVAHTGKMGYSLFISSASELRGHSFDALLQKQVDGVIFASHTDSAMLQSFLDRRIPVVLVNYHSELAGVCSVLSDDFGGIQQTVSYLVNAGHRDIGIIEGRFSPFIYARRHEAFLRSLKEHGIEARSNWMAVTNPTMRDAYESVSAVLSALERPSALVCTNDTIAVAAIKAAHRLGLSVPGDVAVTGYDNSDLCAACEPSITSVDTDAEHLGASAVDFLLRQIAGETCAVTTYTVQTRLVQRESA